MMMMMFKQGMEVVDVYRVTTLVGDSILYLIREKGTLYDFMKIYN